MLDKQLVRKLAKKYGWKQQTNINAYVIEFVRYVGKNYQYPNGFKQQVMVYFTTGTVSTALYHPKSGKTQLHRREIYHDELEQIFKNPRRHTGKGYYKR